MEHVRIDPELARPDPDLAPHFDGRARFQRLAAPGPAGGPGVSAVYFEAGARNHPHVHTGGQVLHFIEGTGVVGFESGEIVTGPGDVISVAPMEWHWHGASETEPTCHVAITSGETRWDVDRRDFASAYQRLRKNQPRSHD